MPSSGFFSPLQKLNPGVSKRGLMAFDVPRGREYSLQVSGGFKSRDHAIVTLSDSTPPEPR
jgi:hypothetical protein